ncbi:rhodanese-like domain-containing protein [Myroides odoratimimus]|uniref:rhodanese-like domain-containing protein n=1 Tax=Myroides odoratimimus TaxID=76832 RepID=UPI00046ABE22|nr:rhodanese-like domain-containing protein [Myroides odoratimimus]
MKKYNAFWLSFIATILITVSGYSQEKVAHLLNNGNFKKAIEATEVQLLDVRTDKEFSEGTIEYAKNINVLEEDFIDKTKTLSKEEPVYIFCKSGKRSEKARNILLEQGFKTVYELDGGYTKWEEAKK